MSPEHLPMEGDVTTETVTGVWRISGDLTPDVADRLRDELPRAAAEGKQIVVVDGLSVRWEPFDSIDAAWSEAEAALPEGWLFHGVSLADHSMDDATGPDDLTWGPDWVASMTWPDHCEYDDCDHDEAFRVGTGDTPAAALRSLAAKLRERAG